MRSGQLRYRVIVCKNVPTTNSDGQQVPAESEWITRWASVKPISGRERMLAQQTQADITHRVRMRYDRDTKTIGPTMHVKFRDGTVLNVERAFDVKMQKTVMELECNQRV